MLPSRSRPSAYSACTRHEGRHDLLPWLTYFLSIVRQAYSELEKRFTQKAVAGPKSELVTQTILQQTGSFSLAELKAQCPSVSPQMIKKVLMALKIQGRVAVLGLVGLGASWTSGPGHSIP